MIDRTTLPASLPGVVFSALFDGPGRTVPKSARLFQPGDLSGSLMLLRRGLVKLSTLSSKGDEITLRVIRPTEIFGECCFFRPVRRHWATALEPSEVTEIPVARALESLSSNPVLALDLVYDLTARLASAYDELQTVSSRIAVIRVAAKLLTLPTIEAAGSDPWMELAHHFTHDELAQIVGVRRETLTRALARLKARGIVTGATGHGMRIHRHAQGFLAASDPART